MNEVATIIFGGLESQSRKYTVEHLKCTVRDLTSTVRRLFWGSSERVSTMAWLYCEARPGCISCLCGRVTWADLYGLRKQGQRSVIHSWTFTFLDASKMNRSKKLYWLLCFTLINDRSAILGLSTVPFENIQLLPFCLLQQLDGRTLQNYLTT